MSSIPNFENCSFISDEARERICAIAKRLEALDEYHPEQALFVATDIVLHASAQKSPAAPGDTRLD